jgi:Reverse transcriptase (RNA-dependent DNA polymerase)
MAAEPAETGATDGTNAQPMDGELLARVLERDNLQRALKQVRRNKGAPGVDGMSVDELPQHLVHHWAAIKADILAGRYRPQPVRRVEIPKPDGRKRMLCIPTVLDRFIQQAIAQIVQAQWEPHFHPDSYGFRPHAWLESVLRCGRGSEPSARAGQMDSATVTLLRMEAMGTEGLSRAAQAGRVRARSMERQQERAWPMANLANPGTIGGDANEFLQRNGPARTGASQGRKRMHSTQRTAVYVTRMHGGVGGRGREVPSYPD